MTRLAYHRAMKLVLAAALSLLVAGAATAQSPARVIREYEVPGHGKFVLEVPESWQQASRAVVEPPSAQLRFSSAETDRFRIQATAIWLDEESRAKATPTDLQETLLASAQAPLAESVETEAVQKELKGEQTIGYYFALTDREVPAGEYKYLIQGIQLTGELLTVYTVLYHDANLPEKQAILDLFAGARYTP